MQSLGNGIFIMKIQLAAFDLHVVLPVALLPPREVKCQKASQWGEQCVLSPSKLKRLLGQRFYSESAEITS